MPWFSKKSLPDRSLIEQRAFRTLTALEKVEGPRSFGASIAELWIAFGQQSAVVTELDLVQQVEGLVGYWKLSKIPALRRAKEMALQMSNVSGTQNIEVALAQELRLASTEIAKLIAGPIVIRNDGDSGASLSKPGDTIVLTDPREIRAFQDLLAFGHRNYTQLLNAYTKHERWNAPVDIDAIAKTAREAADPSEKMRLSRLAGLVFKLERLAEGGQISSPLEPDELTSDIIARTYGDLDSYSGELADAITYSYHRFFSEIIKMAASRGGFHSHQIATDPISVAESLTSLAASISALPGLIEGLHDIQEVDLSRASYVERVLIDLLVYDIKDAINRSVTDRAAERLTRRSVVPNGIYRRLCRGGESSHKGFAARSDSSDRDDGASKIARSGPSEANQVTAARTESPVQRSPGPHTNPELAKSPSNKLSAIYGVKPVLEPTPTRMGANPSIDEIYKRAEKGDRIAQYQLGDLYARSANPDYIKAAKWYAAAADQGHALAQASLGWLYERGFGVQRSDLIAYRFYANAAGQLAGEQCRRIAARRDEVNARIDWPKVLREQSEEALKIAMPKNTTLADDLRDMPKEKREQRFRHVAASLEADRRFNCEQRQAWMKRALAGEVEDYPPANAEWFWAAAENGNPNAQVWLGMWLESGRGIVGIDKDPEHAAQWYEKAADQGEPDAAYRLGIMFERGEGVPQRYDIAARLYELARQIPDALVRLGDLYTAGNGVPQDAIKAAQLYRQAATASAAEKS